MALYFASILPGLEFVLSEEIMTRLDSVEIIQMNRGKVYFFTEDSITSLLTLKSADNIFRVIDQFYIGPHKKHLSQLEDRVSQLDLNFIQEKDSFWVNASRKGKQTYSRYEAAEAVMRGLEKSCDDWKVGTAQNHQIEFRFDIDHHDVILSLRMTDAKFRFRGANRQFSRASLLPTVAHAMVWLSDPKPTDIFIDPCCGSGTILSERTAYPFHHLLGGDISSTAITAAKRNLIESEVKVNVWDARDIPIPSESVDKVVTNLPFGKQISPDEDIQRFNHQVMNEMGRIIKPNGRAVILSDHKEQILYEAKQLYFVCIHQYPLSLKGLHPTLFLFEKEGM